VVLCHVGISAGELILGACYWWSDANDHVLQADLSDTVQTFFRLRIWNFLGKHSMAYFLCQ
jgi:hypothetical protein